MSELKQGDRVVIVVPMNDISLGRGIPTGSTGRLGRMYRVQDGIEMWPMWLDKPVSGRCLVGVTNLHIRKVEQQERKKGQDVEENG